jgi:serine/threonine-protein kinase
VTDGGNTPENFVDEARRYTLDSRIATGGMGEVWRGTDTLLGREVAVKLLKVEYADHPTFRSRFETEARHAASLHHPNVAAVYDFGEGLPTDGSGVHRPYLVMELVDGQPLSVLLASGRPLDPDVTRDLLGQAADALGAAHAAGIVHRDVKPANLLVTPDRTVKITDFGIARAAEGMALTETGQVMGTPQYLSPEQAQGGTATPASDVYSLGVVAFECLAGRRPFVAETAVATALMHLREPVPELPDDVPAPLAAVVRRAMAKTPEDRFPDGKAFAAALRNPASVAPPAAPLLDTASTQVLGPAAIPHEPPTTSTAPVAGPPDEPRSRWWLWLLLALAVVAAIVAIVVFATAGDDDPGGPTEPTTSEPTKRPSQSQSSQGPETVQVNEGDYVGRPVGEVVSELEGLGLNVRRDELDNPGTEDENIVDGVNPSGTLEEGDTVTVSYWGPAPVEPSTPTEPTEPPPTTETTATEPSAPTSPTGDAGATTSSGVVSPSASAISEEDTE